MKSISIVTIVLITEITIRYQSVDNKRTKSRIKLKPGSVNNESDLECLLFRWQCRKVNLGPCFPAESWPNIDYIMPKSFSRIYLRFNFPTRVSDTILRIQQSNRKSKRLFNVLHSSRHAGLSLLLLLLPPTFTSRCRYCGWSILWY